MAVSSAIIDLTGDDDNNNAMHVDGGQVTKETVTSFSWTSVISNSNEHDSEQAPTRRGITRGSRDDEGNGHTETAEYIEVSSYLRQTQPAQTFQLSKASFWSIEDR